MVLKLWTFRICFSIGTFLCAAVPDQVSVNPGAPSADGQQYITSRSLLQSNTGPSYWTVSIHAAAANAQAVRAQVAQLAAMPAQQLASLLRSHGEILRLLVRTHLPMNLGTPSKQSQVVNIGDGEMHSI